MDVIGYRQFINRDLPPRERACTSKVGYVSRGEARSVARHGRHGYAGLHPYRCRYCDGWHLGHRRAPRWRVSQAVVDAGSEPEGVQFVEIGPVELKGVGEAVRLHQAERRSHP